MCAAIQPPMRGFGAIFSPRTRLNAPFIDPAELSLVPAATETVVGDGSSTRVRHAVAMPSAFHADNNVTWRRWLFAIRAQRHRSAEATPPYGTYDYQVVCVRLLLKC